MGAATKVDAWSALGDPTRRGIFAQVVARPRSVTALARDFPVSRPAVSQHLRVLQEADLVVLRVDGPRHIYEARPTGLAAMRTELDGFWGSVLANFKAMTQEATEQGDRQ